MNASAAVRGLFRIPRAGPAFRRSQAGEDAAPPSDWHARAENIRYILRWDGHTITQLSTASRWRYGSGSPYFIPATFLYQLRNGVTPHLCQIVALSECTGYRFADWLRICGFDLQQIPRLQFRLHPERTVLITPVEDCFEPFFPQPFVSYERIGASSACSREEERNARRRYLFARIGTSDARVCPGLLPGAMVRVDRHYAHRLRGVDPVALGQLLWLVEQSTGLTCCQLKWIDDRQVVLLPSRPPWGHWPLRIPTEARILGVIDIDMDTHPQEVKAESRAGPTNLEPLSPPPRPQERLKFSELLRNSRGRAGLTLRAAHRLTRAMAQILGDPEYAIALGMLSDYEASDRLPRHIAKILSLCVIYCVDIRELMGSAGVHIDESTKLPLPIPQGRLQIDPEFPDHAAHSRIGSIVTRYVHSAGSAS